MIVVGQSGEYAEVGGGMLRSGKGGWRVKGCEGVNGGGLGDEVVVLNQGYRFERGSCLVSGVGLQVRGVCVRVEYGLEYEFGL